MVENSHSEWVLHVEALHTRHVAGNLGNALTETHDAVVKEGTSVPIGRVGISKSWGREGSRESKVSTPYFAILTLNTL